MQSRSPRGIVIATGLAALFVTLHLQAQSRPLWAPKAPEKPEAPPMPVTEKPEAEFEMERPVFDRPAAGAEIERPAAPAVATALPSVVEDEALPVAEKPVRRQTVRGSALPEPAEPAPVEAFPEPVSEPLLAEAPEPVEPAASQPKASVAVDEAVATQAVPARLDEADAVPVEQPLAAPSPEERMAMNVPSAPPLPPASAQEAGNRLKVLSRGRLPQLPAAFYNGEEGWVRLEFELDANGKPVNIHVLESQPRRVFNRVAMKYLRTWRYQVDGMPEDALKTRRKVKVEFRH